MGESIESRVPDTWVIRAGRRAVHAEAFLENGCVTIGLTPEVGKEALGMTREQLVERTRQSRPSWTRHKVASQAGQLSRFVSEIQVGDRVASYDRDRRLFFVGTVASEPTFDPTITEGQPFVRKVAWAGRVSRDSLSVEARNSLGAIMSLFKVQGAAADELCNRSVPLDAPQDVTTPDEPDSEADLEDTSLDDLRDEVSEKAAEFIEDMIAKLEWDGLQELVAGILRAMGYKTRVSAPGPDRGVDVFASPDGLGLEEPRIFVEVKHRRNTAMGASEIRSFLGGRKAGDRCLYVSTGGFTKEARYEADRSEIPLTLLALSELQQLVVEHYEAMDIEARSLVPLTKVLWPVSES